MKHAVACLCLGAALAGCAEDTGILLAVSARAGVSLDELEIHVAVDRGGWFLLEPEISGKRHRVKGRTLATDPYEHLLREQDESGAPLRVRAVVVGRSDGEDTHVAVTEPAQPFVRGEVVRRALQAVSLGGDAGLVRRSTGCLGVWFRTDGKEVWSALGGSNDHDCDGHSPPSDCADADPAVHPDANEVCDGKDNNCDGAYFLEIQKCYVQDPAGALCLEGERSCGDAVGEGWIDDCTAKSATPPVDSRFCEAYEVCAGAADPLACAFPGELSCVLETQEKEPGGVCEARYRIEHPLAIEPCQWEIRDTGGFSVGLSDGTSAPAGSIAVCAPWLVVQRLSPWGGGQVELVLRAGGVEWVLRVAMSSGSVRQCRSRPMQCE